MSTIFLIPICQRLIPAGKCRFVIHADNSRCHPAKVGLEVVSQRKIRFAPHEPQKALRRGAFNVDEELPMWAKKVVLILSDYRPPALRNIVLERDSNIPLSIIPAVTAPLLVFWIPTRRSPALLENRA
jgi:hypothetical protein